MTEISTLRSEETDKKLVLARNFLAGARNALEYKDFRLATDAGYNAAELAMKVGILLRDEEIPRRHGSISQLFNLLYVKNRDLNETIGQRISNGLEFRNNARYDENAKITHKHAQHNISLAKELIEFLEKKLKEK